MLQGKAALEQNEDIIPVEGQHLRRQKRSLCPFERLSIYRPTSALNRVYLVLSYVINSLSAVVSSANNLCKPYGFRSGRTKRLSKFE